MVGIIPTMQPTVELTGSGCKEGSGRLGGEPAYQTERLDKGSGTVPPA
jgi:hypothetical protein